MTHFYRWVRLFCMGMLACAIAMAWNPQAVGQISSLSEGSVIGGNFPPNGVNRYGSLEVTWVTSQLGGEKLFQIASPTVLDRRNLSNEQLPVELRAKNIEDLLRLEVRRFREHAIERLFNNMDAADEPRSAQVIISTLRNLTVLQVANTNSSRPLTLATVTSTDADFYSETPAVIAKRWEKILEGEIDKIEAVYSPPALLKKLQQTALIPVGLLIITVILLLLRHGLGRRCTILKAQYSTEEAQATAVDVTDGSSEIAPNQREQAPGLTDLQQQQFSLANQVALYRLLQLFLFWLIVLTWYLGVYAITTQLPILMQWSNTVLTQPLRLLIIWFVTSLLIRISNVVIQRSTNVWRENPQPHFGDARRQVLRSQTLASALKGLINCMLIVLGILLTLTQFGLPAASILAGSALLGLAISFGAQNLVKDVVNGSLILLEDQFAVGDVITTQNESGVVETLNLRLTQLRNTDGDLISVPNSSITVVKNKTSSWSRVNLGIEVAYSTDLDHAIAVIEEVATQLTQDPQWRPLILDQPQVLGVDDFGENSVTIRLWIQTEPLKQWEVGREFRRRLKLAFDQEGISIPFPQRSVWFKTALKTSKAEDQKLKPPRTESSEA
ncbi:MAG: mechanosensitive ion channel family protein [Thermosynechococcaceae cyanobacterium]